MTRITALSRKKKLKERPQKGLPTRSPSPTDNQEEDSQDILKGKLPISERIFQFYKDKYPNRDGHIEFVDGDGATGVSLYFQLKSTKISGEKHFDMDRLLLNYFYKSPEPLFLIFVNISDDKVYWQHITPAYITVELDIPNLEELTQETVRIPFSDSKVIDNNSGELLRLCREHYESRSKTEEYKQEAQKRSAKVSGQELVIEEVKEAVISEQQQELATENLPDGKKHVKSTTVSSFEKQVASLFEDIQDKSKLYYAFVYTLRPFFLDKRGDGKRIKLTSLLKVTDIEERLIIEKLTNANLVTRSGDLLSVEDRQLATNILADYLKKGAFSLEEILDTFK